MEKYQEMPETAQILEGNQSDSDEIEEFDPMSFQTSLEIEGNKVEKMTTRKITYQGSSDLPDFCSEAESITSGSEYLPSGSESVDSDSSDSSHIVTEIKESARHSKKDVNVSESSKTDWNNCSDISLEEEESSIIYNLKADKESKSDISEPIVSSDYSDIEEETLDNVSSVTTAKKCQDNNKILYDSPDEIEKGTKDVSSADVTQSKVSPKKKLRESFNNRLPVKLPKNVNYLTYKNPSLMDIDANNKSLNESSEVSGLGSLDTSLVNINLKSVGEALKNKCHEVLPCSTDGCKKNACFYCIKKAIEDENNNMTILFTKLPEHYDKKHPEERLVVKLKRLQNQKLKLIEKGSNHKGKKVQNILTKRKKILAVLRIKANHLNNLRARSAQEYVVRRRPKQSGKTISSYLPCFHCTQVFSESSLRKHVKCCSKLSFKKKHVVKSRGRATNGDYHESASEDSIKIISKMRETEAVKEIKFDKTVFMWLNAEATRFETQKHNYKKVKASLSRLGTLLKLIKEINPNISELCDVFNEKYYDDFIKSVRIMGKPDPDSNFMQSPATANDMFNLIKHVYEIYEVKIGPEEEDKRKLVQRFDIVLRKMWHYSIGKTIAETQGRRDRNKVNELPSDADTILLNKHLLEVIVGSHEKLDEKYSDEQYERFRDALLSYLQSVNARRPGEVERLEKEDYEHLKIQGQECLIIPRGKRNRGVPIVFDLDIKFYLDYLLSLRPKALIFENNPFIFATIHDVSADEFGFVSACNVLKKFATSSKAEKPETLKGTRIRMKVATVGMQKGLKEPEVQNLASYMGHTPGIHKQNYRQSVVEVNLQVAKQVREAQGISNGFDSTEEPESSLINDQSFNDEQQSSETNYNPITSVSEFKQKTTYSKINTPSIKTLKSKRTISSNIQMTSASTSKKYRPLRMEWKKPAIKAVLEHFPNALNLQYKVPSAVEINHFLEITEDPDLQLRTEGQVRSWMHTQRNLKKGEADVPERNHIPGYIYSYFKQYIDAGKTPSHKRCIKFLADSPSKSNVTISNIQTWVDLAIKKKGSKKVSDKN